MPAVSGSPTQLAASVTTLANLAGLPDDAYKDGDFAYVQSTRATYQLDRTSAATPSAVAVDAFSGNGQWVFFQASTSWETQATWYIDPATGDDENDGNTTATALATFAEFNRRVTMVSIPMTVTILSDTTENLVGTFETGPDTLASAYLIIQGTPTVLASGIGTYTARVAGTNGRNTIAVAGVADFTAYVGSFLRAPQLDALSGPFIAAILKNAGATAYTGNWCRKNLSTTAPASGNVYEIVRMTAVGSFQLVAPNLTTRAYYLETAATGAVNHRSFISNVSARVNSAIIGNAMIFACKFNDGYANAFPNGFIGGCLFTTTFSTYNFGYTCFLYGCSATSDIMLSWSGQWTLADLIIQGGRLIIGQSSTTAGNILVETSLSLGVYDAPGATGAIAVERSATLSCASGDVFGNGNAGWGLTVKNGGRVFMSSSAVQTITGAAGQEVQVNGAATAISPLVAGGAVPAASPLTTWAHWAGAPFNKYVFNYSNGTTLAVLT